MAKGGFVYILRNESMPGLLKIGFTTKTPGERASELFSCGVPLPFEIVYAVWSADPQHLEQAIHEWMHYCRVSESREFFRTNESDAIGSLLKLSTSGISNINIVRDWAFISPEVLEDYASHVSVYPSDIGPWLSEVLQHQIAAQQLLIPSGDLQNDMEE